MTAAVSDAVPGYLGLLARDPGAVAVLRLAETDADVPPVDDRGALTGARGAPSLPPVVDGYTGPARDLDGTVSILLDDASGRALLQRTVSVLALVRFDVGATSGPDGILSHGLPDGSVEERRSWYLRLAKPSAGVARVEWVWDDAAGTERVQTGQAFDVPASGFVLVAATREWVGDRFLLRYWASGARLGAEVESADLSVGGGIPATVVLGGTGAAGSVTEWFHGEIDQVAVLDVALTDEHVAYLWRRIATDQVDMSAALAELEPPGRARSTAPDALVTKVRRARAGALAAISGLARLSRSAGRPSRAFGARLAAWERTAGVEAREDEGIEARRARLEALLSLKRGLSVSAVDARLDAVLPDTTDYLTQGHDYRLTWPDTRVVPRYLASEPGAATTWAPDLGANFSAALSAAAEGRWHVADEAPHVRQAVEGEALFSVGVTVETTSISDTDVVAGVVLYDHASREGLILGVGNGGDVVRAVLDPAAGLQSITSLDASPPSPVYLRVDVLGDGNARLAWDASGFGSPSDETTIALSFTPTRVGFSLLGQDMASTASAEFGEYLAYFPASARVFAWMAHVDAPSAAVTVFENRLGLAPDCLFDGALSDPTGCTNLTAANGAAVAGGDQRRTFGAEVYAFDGTADQRFAAADTTTGDAPDDESFAVFAVVKVTSVDATSRGIAGKIASNDGWQLNISSSDLLTFTAYHVSSAPFAIQNVMLTAASTTAGEWRTIVGVIDRVAEEVRFASDIEDGGASVGSFTQTTENTGNLALGAGLTFANDSFFGDVGMLGIVTGSVVDGLDCFAAAKALHAVVTGATLSDARLIARRTSAAYAQSLVSTVSGVLCDDADNGCDHAPLAEF